jgi:hypothetical protein
LWLQVVAVALHDLAVVAVLVDTKQQLDLLLRKVQHIPLLLAAVVLLV